MKWTTAANKRGQSQDPPCKNWEATPKAKRIFTLFDITSFEEEEIEAVFTKLAGTTDGWITKEEVEQRAARMDLYQLSTKQIEDLLTAVFQEQKSLSSAQFKALILEHANAVDASLYGLCLTFVATGLSVGVIIPMMPQLASLLSLSSTQYGILISSFAFAKMLGNFPAAYLVDTYGRKQLIVAGLAILSLSNLELAFLMSYQSILASRLIAGLGVAGFSTAATAFLSDISTSKNRARTLAPPMAAFSVGTGMRLLCFAFLISVV